MLAPKVLKSGDTVALCATARFVENDVIEKARQLLKKRGYQVLLAENLDKRQDQMAGSDQDRSDAFQKLISNKDIQAIWCLRGGFGSLRILDSLDFTALKKYPKWLLGFSDFTSILNQTVLEGIMAVHAPMPIQLPELSQEAEQSLFNCIEKGEMHYQWENIEKDNVPGEVKGTMIGGNLSVLYSLLGSKSYPKSTDGILFLEDLDEYIYHIDRMLLAMKRAGAFKGLKAVVVGSFSDLHDHATPFGMDYRELILGHFSEFNIPVSFNFPAGHQNDNRAIIFGKEVFLKIAQNHASISTV